jgi:hypothetical protein
MDLKKYIKNKLNEYFDSEFSPEEFFGDAGMAAQDDIEAEYGKDGYTKMGDKEDVNKFVKDVMNSSEEEAQEYLKNAGAEFQIGDNVLVVSTNAQGHVEKILPDGSYKLSDGKVYSAEDLQIIHGMFGSKTNQGIY